MAYAVGQHLARLVPVAPPSERPVYGAAREVFERSGPTEEDIAKALAPMSEEELRERGIECAAGWPTPAR